ncbi:nucleotidyl transferase AbiEii/AbiGii toxin family protein [Actinomadura scrupuli]|uniref:nucleotidyl transferase AbiEii/AbiGii toxin family protein n=1 Tax=Actinomadura scrupuli TaxID=559629 RepID=UPI003D962500
MTSAWEKFDWGPWPATAEVPHHAPDEATRHRRSLPLTLRPVTGDGVSQVPVFDPALKHHGMAMRAGDPRFADRALGARWYAARRTAIDHVLAAVTTSRWADHLVLRGSILLKAWYGDAAREPGDLDFVVVPESWKMSADRTASMLDDIAHLAEDGSWRGGDALTDASTDASIDARIDASEAVIEDIWTYDRVPGRRLLLPWTADGLPSGTVQLDFVFNEHLPAPPEVTSVPRAGGGAPIPVLAASAELSLAWKIMWLVSDMHPQGKDLYDAVLLAESTPLPGRLLRETLVASDSCYARQPITPAAITGLEVEWDEFCKEHPHVPRDAREYVDRLAAALAPTFAEQVEPPGTEYQRRAAWLAPRVAHCLTLMTRDGRDGRDGMEAAQSWLVEQSVHAIDAIVITSELLGAEARGVQDAADLVLKGSPAWARTGWRGYYERNPGLLAAELTRLREDR